MHIAFFSQEFNNLLALNVMYVIVSTILNRDM